MVFGCILARVLGPLCLHTVCYKTSKSRFSDHAIQQTQNPQLHDRSDQAPGVAKNKNMSDRAGCCVCLCSLSNEQGTAAGFAFNVVPCAISISISNINVGYM